MGDQQARRTPDEQVASVAARSAAVAGCRAATTVASVGAAAKTDRLVAWREE